MKWSYVIQQKLKVAGLLASIIFLIVLSNMIEKRNLENINRSFNSIYHDRLIPATEIFYLSENLYNKRLIMEKLLASKENELPLAKANLGRLNYTIDSLLMEFEKTYMVDQESKVLLIFENKVTEYADVENSILGLIESGSNAAGADLYENKGKAIIQSTIQHLYSLAKIQSSVGEELINNSKVAFANTNTLSSLQIGLAIIICLIVQVLLLTSKIVHITKQNYKLN